MRKGKTGKKLSRKAGPRKALLVSLTRELLTKERIKTTQTRAKEVARIAEKIITKAKTNTLAARRALSFLTSAQTKTFLDKIVARMKERKGGYTRVTKLGFLKSNGAKMALVELVK